MNKIQIINKISKNSKDSRPLYVIIYEKLFDLIKEGYFKSGQKLPGEHTLANKFGVSRGTLRQALLILQEDGIIYNYQGKGNFVSHNKKIFGTGLEHKGNILNIANQGDIKLTNDIEVLFESPNKMLQSELKIKANEIILVVKRVYRIEKTEVSYFISFIPYKNINKEEIDIEDHRNLVHYLDNEFYGEVANSQSEILLTEAGDFIANKLNIREYTPLVLFEEDLYKTTGEMLAFYKQYFLPEYFSFYINRK
ncbi:GntR family transcriptional regulator [Halanaerobium sp. ST460_2HS_T2]|uniref:GntR family transcriptional regulator n=1 Tax=Halanaerobium sp. ST460_2HS_T2 TaxID=2183914 RepID=UPI000DFD1E91|nr:GntR family transcriptional regulator [Halanaerobium sp. ST460_2HS_T2]RCW52374.1 GntR family transcriptional regulator [Halanaerobium sp. ST460_2HS_T2]